MLSKMSDHYVQIFMTRNEMATLKSYWTNNFH